MNEIQVALYGIGKEYRAELESLENYEQLVEYSKKNVLDIIYGCSLEREYWDARVYFDPEFPIGDFYTECIVYLDTRNRLLILTWATESVVLDVHRETAKMIDEFCEKKFYSKCWKVS